MKIGVSGQAQVQKALQTHLAKILTEPVAHVRVGFLEGATYEDGTPVALVAGAQEFGVPADPEAQGQDNDAGEYGERPDGFRGIPAKHFMRGTVAEQKEAWAEHLRGQLSGDKYDLEKSLGRTGQVMKGDLMTTILTIEHPEVSEATKKHKKGKLLVETRTLLRAVDSEVVLGDTEE